MLGKSKSTAVNVMMDELSDSQLEIVSAGAKIPEPFNGIILNGLGKLGAQNNKKLGIEDGTPLGNFVGGVGDIINHRFLGL